MERCRGDGFLAVNPKVSVVLVRDSFPEDVRFLQEINSVAKFVSTHFYSAKLSSQLTSVFMIFEAGTQSTEV